MRNGIENSAPARVITYAAPQAEGLSEDYQVKVNGLAVDVYLARVNEFPHHKLDFGGDYSFIQFDISGAVQVEIHAPNRSLDGTVIRPASGVEHTQLDDQTLQLTLHAPTCLSVEPQGKRRPLLLFANPVEAYVPDPGDPSVRYFGPGLHRPEDGVIELTSNQTLYLAGGAVVEGAVVAKGAENVAIRGRGILCGNAWSWRQGPASRMVKLTGCRNVTVEGIIIRGSWQWTLVPENCENVEIVNVKICNSRVNNDDGINPCNSRHVVIRDCFVRTDDDCIAIKGLRREWGNVEDVLIENTVLWCDRARATLLAHESRADKMQGIVYRNIDIIHFGEWPIFLLEPGDGMEIGDVLFDQIRINGEGQDKFAIIRPIINMYNMGELEVALQGGAPRSRACGHIRNVTFRDVALDGQTGKYQTIIEGWSEENRTAGLTFENVTILGELLREDSMRVVFGHNRENYVEMSTIKFRA
jgi:hypothetical protein